MRLYSIFANFSITGFFYASRTKLSCECSDYSRLFLFLFCRSNGNLQSGENDFDRYYQSRCSEPNNASESERS